MTEEQLIGSADTTNHAREIQRDLRAVSATWKKQHRKRVEELCVELDGPDAGGAEKNLHRLAAQDLAHLQELEGTEIVVLRQLGMFVEAGSYKNVEVLSTVLTNLTKLRSEGTKRATELLRASEELAARRALNSSAVSNRNHLRSVG